jgi:hypothetical protein
MLYDFKSGLEVWGWEVSQLHVLEESC